MPNIAEKKTTRLEGSDPKDIQELLNWKLEAKGPEGVTDYVGLAIDNIDAEISRIKEAETMLKERKSFLEGQKSNVKNEARVWLEDAGIKKLEGTILSSMSVADGKTSEVLEVMDEQALVNAGYFTQSVDKKAVKKAIEDGDEVAGAKITVIHNEATLRISKRKVKNVENTETE